MAESCTVMTKPTHATVPQHITRQPPRSGGKKQAGRGAAGVQRPHTCPHRPSKHGVFA